MSSSVPVPRPAEVRGVDLPPARALADLAGVFEDLQTVLRCCERLMAALHSPSGEADDLALEAYWTTAVLSYGRCFAGHDQGQRLTEDDVRATGLAGDVVGWHQTLEQVRRHYVDPTLNPRESFSVGVARNESGGAAGVAITSSRHPLVDEVTVRQTGAIAFELSRIVDGRIVERQQQVFDAVAKLGERELDALPLLDVVEIAADAGSGPGGEGGPAT
jgi:hypothetical protein